MTTRVIFPNSEDHRDHDNYRAPFYREKAQELYLSTIRSCPICNGKGYKYTEFFDKKSMMTKRFPCQCRWEYVYRLQLMIAGVKKSSSTDAIYVTPKKIQTIEIDLSTQKPKSKKPFNIYKLLNKYTAERDEVMKNGYSMLFVGPNSSGKTFAATWVLQQFLKFGYSAHYIRLSKLMNTVNTSKTGNADERRLYYRLLKEITSVDILVIDEVLKEGGSAQNVRTFLEETLKNRETDLKPTILISNGKMDNLINKYQVHFLSALMKRYRAFYFDPSIDLRQQARQEWFA